MKAFVIYSILGILLVSAKPLATIYKTQSSKVAFSSEAPMEIIKAESNKMVGLINTEKKSFAFQVSVISFQGFNSDLQREHFNENYMESTKYPKLKFVGKIIDEVDFNKSFTQEVNIEGVLNVHGVEKPRKLKATLKKTGGKISVVCDFQVTLIDHNISIPTIVNQKLAKVISIKVSADLVPK
ncbi:MAG: hypothetical protein CL840_20080 [Crocinitomicaceae bacterium]|nr:hypothetical protein [Crocinitomicaceae bacterium]